MEELLRYESPVQHTARIAPNDLELGGKKIAKGDRVVVVLAAANRDPAKFADPDTLDLARAKIGTWRSAGPRIFALAPRSPAWKRKLRSLFYSGGW